MVFAQKRSDIVSHLHTAGFQRPAQRKRLGIACASLINLFPQVLTWMVGKSLHCIEREILGAEIEMNEAIAQTRF